MTDILTHIQLYSSAAYVRKFSKVEDVGDITRVSAIIYWMGSNIVLTRLSQLETTIYTSCGRCRKAIAMSPSSIKTGYTKGGYSYCRSCQQSVPCAIWCVPLQLPSVPRLRLSTVVFPFGPCYFSAQYVPTEVTRSATGGIIWNNLWSK